MISRFAIKKQRGRRPLAALATLSIVAGMLITGGLALAVHDAAVFELDANAVDNPAAAGVDWDVIFAQANTPPDGCAGTIACSFTHEEDGETIFTGGASKDDLDIPGWQHKSGNVPPKDDLADGFAARYTVAGYDPDGALGPLLPPSDIIYFGADRTSNSGDAFMGFWFFQGNVTALPGGTFGPSAHVDGDVLVITDFSGGGDNVNLAVYEWNGPGGTIPGNGAINGTLDELIPYGAADCLTVGANDPACATVNDVPIFSPWPFLDRNGNQILIPTGQFVEGGINLTALGLGDQCFSSFLAETRSSTSVNATLKDFIGGQFDVCNATLATLVSSSSVNPGVAVTDTATVTGSSPSNNPSGTVTFFLCSFAAGSTTACDGTGLPTDTPNKVGTQLTNVPPQGNLTGSGGVSTAVSPEVNTAGNALLPGRYCFRAEWPGDSNYVGALKEFSIATECFTVVQSGTTTVTSPQSGDPLADITTVLYNASVVDHAVITGATGFGTPTGAVNFFLCNPTQTTGAAGSEVCATGGTPDAGNPITATAVAGSSPPKSEATSSPTTVNLLGVWCYRAEYDSNTANYTDSSDARHSECFTVTTTSAETSLQNWLPNDQVTLTSVGGFNLNGNVVITLRESSCTGIVKYTEPTFTSPTGGWASGTNFDTTNGSVAGTTFRVTAANIVSGGVYYWRAVFTSTDPNIASFTKCETSTLSINNNP